MTARHILYLTNESLVSLVSRGGSIARRAVFPVAGGPGEAFESRVGELRRLPTHLVTDLAEEDFRVDTIPHLGSRDQAAVLARKLSQLFRNTPYKHAVAQGREADGRRDDRVLYTAITNGEVLRPWLEVLQRLEVPVAGIHSSAVFSGRLLAELGLEFPHTLLATFTPGDALRQTYFRSGEIKFSRLTPVDLEQGETLGDLLAGETGRTWQYLDSLRYFAPTDRLEVCVLIHPKDRPAAEAALRDYDQIQYRLLDIEQVAGRLGLKPPPLGSSAEEVLANLFLRRPAENHFAPMELRRFAILRSARIAINTVAGGILAAGLAYGGWNLAEALQSHEMDLATAKRIRDAQAELESITRAMPAQGVAGQTMRDTVAFFSGSLRGYPTVAGTLLPVSAVLQRYPKVRLTQVAWQAADDDRATPSLAPIVPKEAPPLRSYGKGSAAAPADAQRAIAATANAAAADNAPFSSGRQAVALLEGTVTVNRLDFREALALVESLAADIGRIPGCSASIVDSPLDLTSRMAITAKLGESDPAVSQARFSLRVTRATEPRT
ncbi:MAG: hypothetical protein AB7P08_07655 [Burkholderiales bacterium]